jgi:hypothetical protein
MLKIMARENMAEWGNTVSVEHETIRAVVMAFAEGKVKLEPPHPAAESRDLRFAPSYIPGHGSRSPENHVYTARTIAKFIGWLQPSGQAQHKVEDALAAVLDRHSTSASGWPAQASAADPVNVSGSGRAGIASSTIRRVSGASTK